MSSGGVRGTYAKHKLTVETVTDRAVDTEPNCDQLRGTVTDFVCFEAQGNGTKRLKGPTSEAVKKGLKAADPKAKTAWNKRQLFERYVTLLEEARAAPTPAQSELLSKIQAALAAYAVELDPGDCDHADYHDNFNSKTWHEVWEVTCRKAKEQHGPCDMHIDGAKYHKDCINPSPTGSALRPAMVDFIRQVQTEKGIELASETELAAKGKGKLTRPDLYDLLKPHKPEKKWRASVIAAKYGHRILWTPPYMHPLAFCEPIWNAVKTPISRDCAKDMADLKARLKSNLENMPSKTIVRCYAMTRKAQDEMWWRFENEEMDVVEGGALEEESESDEEEEEQ